MLGRCARRLLPVPAWPRNACCAATSATPASAPVPHGPPIAAVSAGLSYLPFCCRPSLAVLTLGVPLMTLGRWLYLGGGEIWRLDACRKCVRSNDRPCGCRRRADDDRGRAHGLAVGPRTRPIRSACSKPAIIMSASLPGVVVALALVTITVRLVAAALPDFCDPHHCLCPALPAACDGRPSCQHRTSACGAGTGCHVPGTHAIAGRAPDDHAPCCTRALLQALRCRRLASPTS